MEGNILPKLEICIGDEASGTRFIEPLVELQKLQETTSITSKLPQTIEGPIKSLEYDIRIVKELLTWNVCGHICKELMLLIAKPSLKCDVGFFLYKTIIMKSMYKLCK
jgi:hypothetical protein